MSSPGSSTLSDPRTATTSYERNFAIRGDYQRPNTQKTLAEGLAEYYRVNPGLLDPGLMADDVSGRYFRCHDTTHVIFGTHTGPLDEGVNDLYTMFGVKVSYPRYVYGFLKSQGAAPVAKEYGKLQFGAVVRSVWGALQVAPRVWRICRSMKKKWPWDPPKGALDRPLAELREEYGIQVFRAEVVLRLGPGT